MTAYMYINGTDNAHTRSINFNEYRMDRVEPTDIDYGLLFSLGYEVSPVVIILD